MGFQLGKCPKCGGGKFNMTVLPNGVRSWLCSTCQYVIYISKYAAKRVDNTPQYSGGKTYDDYVNPQEKEEKRRKRGKRFDK